MTSLLLKFVGLSRAALWLIPPFAAFVAMLSVCNRTEAVIEPIYTFPFYDANNTPICAFHCYYDPDLGWHEGTDYELGVSGAGGEYVVAAAAGTATTCPLSSLAGYHVEMDHGNGHRTRYLHLQSYAISYGPNVSAGQLIGLEGNTGYTDPPGFYHLHFEAREGATALNCSLDATTGRAVDPYAGPYSPGTYMWATNPPNYAQGETIGVSSWASNRLDVFVRGNNGAMYHRWWDGTAWSGWEYHPGCLRGGPSAVSRMTNRIDVFVRGCYDYLHKKSWNGSSWSDWQDLGGCLRSEPAVASWVAPGWTCFSGVAMTRSTGCTPTIPAPVGAAGRTWEAA